MLPKSLKQKKKKKGKLGCTQTDRFGQPVWARQGVLWVEVEIKVVVHREQGGKHEEHRCRRQVKKHIL